MEIDETKGESVVLNHIEDLLRKEHFQKDIREIREAYKITESHRLNNELEVLDEAICICEKYDLPKSIFKYILCDLINFETKEEHILKMYHVDLCMIDFYDEHEDELMKEVEKEWEIDYPITIRIRPEASINQIKDFIDKKSKHIKFLQKRYSTRIKSGTRKRPNKELNDFIYENQQMNRKVLMKIVNNKFKKTMSYSEISKKISEENKRRNSI